MWNQKTCFWVTIHSDIYHMHADVGPRRLECFPHHRRRGRGDDIMGVDAERMLQSIHTNFVRLTHRVPVIPKVEPRLQGFKLKEIFFQKYTLMKSK